MSKEFPGARKGVGATPLNGPVLETGEKITAIDTPAYGKRYPYKSANREAPSVSDDVASTPVSMKPKRQVKGSGETPSASEDNVSTPVSMPPKMRKA